ncbi:MBL fold metallo-hydrolase [Dactylosporangium sp. NPDC048998]|uniref:MBL fold metallo-hydrolase n=1 Tax=Dactylosporangium sp. NPDC048998 TaxID=3363976 RepID=UPI0037207846
MKIVKYTHSCVRVERDGAVIVIDPGAFTELESVDGVDAILLTHEHFDHLDVQKLVDAVAKRPAVTVFTHPEVTPKLGEFGGAVTEVVPGDEFTAAGFKVRAYGGLHAIIHPELPRVANVGFFVEGEGAAGGVYHPGDSFDVPADADVDTLFVPVAAPWLKLTEAVEFVRAIKPRRAFALHDGMLNDIGNQLVTQFMSLLSGSDYARLDPVASA